MTFLKITEKDAEVIASAKDFGFTDCWTENMVIESLEKGRLSGEIAVAGDKKAGYITYSFAQDVADIDAVFVLPEYRKQGLATALLSRVLSALKECGVKKVFLEVRKSNLPAINLYSASGFFKISERKKYYGDGEDALVFSKEI